MPKQIQQPFIGQKLVKAFGLKGRFQPLLDEVLVPVIIAGSTFDPDELNRLAWGGALGPAPGAGNVNRFNLLNPAGNTVDMIVETLEFIQPSGAADTVALDAVGTAGAAGVTNERWRDFRLPGDPQCRVTRNTAAVAVLAAPGWSIRANETLVLRVPLVLPPNTLVRFRQGTANQALNLTVTWREVSRPAYEG